MVTTEICSFNQFLKSEPLSIPSSVMEVTFVIFQQNNQKGLWWTLSVLLFQEGQWRQLLKAGFLRATSSLQSSGQLSIYMVSCKASNLKIHLVLTSSQAIISRSKPKHTREMRKFRNECVYIVFALMLPRVYFQSEERTMHSRLLNPNIISLKLGACSQEYFSPVLKGPLEEGVGEGRLRTPGWSWGVDCCEFSSGSGLPLWTTAVCHMEWIRPSLSHCQLGCSVHGLFLLGSWFCFL